MKTDEEKIAAINELLYDHMNEGDIAFDQTLNRIREIAEPVTCREGEHPFGLHRHGHNNFDYVTARRLV